MTTPRPSEETRLKIMKAVVSSVLLPGWGHLQAGRMAWAIFWFLICQGFLFVGLALAGNSQLDLGIWLGFRSPIPGSSRALFVMLPEMGNFIGSQIAPRILESIEFEGQFPERIPLRSLGYLLSGASGLLALFSAAHAAGCILVARENRTGRSKVVNPGGAAVATLLLPGLGHWMTGRKFKALYLGGTVIGLFLLGMALGDFADFDRQRHPYYWAGQMAVGPCGWMVGLLTSSVRFVSVPPFIDAGLLFTTTAGLFTVVVALDAYHRAEHDLLAGTEKPDPGDGAESPAIVSDGLGAQAG